jgi:hypothetical protein
LNGAHSFKFQVSSSKFVSSSQPETWNLKLLPGKQKSPEAAGASGLAGFGVYRSRPLTPGVSNNNHDLDYTDSGRDAANRALGNQGHGRKPHFP